MARKGSFTTKGKTLPNKTAIRRVFFVGSTSHQVQTLGAAMNYFAGCLHGTHEGGLVISTPAFPGGELTDSHWVDEQLHRLDGISAFRRVKKATFGETENYFGLPLYVPRRGQVADVKEINLLFEDRVRAIYPEFQATAKNLKLGQPRLQVGINVVDLLIFGTWWWAPGQLDAFIERTRMEVEAILKFTNGNVFFVIESPTFKILSNLTRCRPGILKWYLDAFARIVRTFQGAPWGFHFCDGRLGGDALGDQGVTKKLSLYDRIHHHKYTVKASNFLLHGLEKEELVPDLVHYPFVAGSRRPSLDRDDYEVYRNLYVPEKTQVFAGAISNQLGLEEQGEFYHILDGVLGRPGKPHVGSANSCGYGSDDLQGMLSSFDRIRYVSLVA
jgi:hypothetical protein